ncbi:hypothetical protein GCM10028787_28960 [Brachybacterium horti]
MMGKKSVKAGVVGACAAMVIFGGAAAANAGVDVVGREWRLRRLRQ